LEHFVNDALGLRPHQGTLSGLEYVHDMLLAAATNSYVETLGDHADSLHRLIRRTPMDQVVNACVNRTRAVGARFNLAQKDVVLALDHTDEDYYGKLTSPWLHTWTGEAAVTGKWKFLTCAIVNRDDPPKVPILSLPTPVGSEVAHQVAFILERVKPLVKSITLTLYDRGFYTRYLMQTLSRLEVPYLILVPTSAVTKRELETMKPEERKLVAHDFEYRRDKTTQRGRTTLALLKHIFDPRLRKHWDWAFATNQAEPDLERLIGTYKGRWRIETGFRVQDQARIHSNSTEVQIRFFYYAFEQALQFAWGALYKPATPFKSFIVQAWQCSQARLENANRKRTPRAGVTSRTPTPGPEPDPSDTSPR
jgi:DDE family transposase